MAEVTRESIMAAVATAKPHVMVVLKKGPNYDTTGDLHMAHLQHIFTMRAAEQQVLTMPVMSESDIRGIGVFATADVAEAEALVKADPGVAAGRFVYEMLSVMGMPGDGV